MCVMRRKEVDLLFGVSRTCTAQINKDWHWSNDNQRHKRPPKSWVEDTANYTVHISLLAGIDHSGIYRIAVYSWLNPRVGKMKGFSYIMNDYLNVQDGPILPPLEFPCWSCKKKVFFWSYNRSLINQTSSFKMAGYNGLFLYFSLILIHKKKHKKELCQYPGIFMTLTCNAWSVSHSHIILHIVECTCYMYKAVCSPYFSTRFF